MAKRFGRFELLWVVEEDNDQFKSGRGQIGVIGIKTDGWSFEPLVYFFKWATEGNRIRSLVAFFQMMRYQKNVGVCVMKATSSEKTVFDKMKDYGVLFYRGRIPHGTPSGDMYIYSIDGKKE